MEGYDPMGTHYLPDPLAMSHAAAAAAATTEEYLNIMAPMPLPDHANSYTTNAYQR